MPLPNPCVKVLRCLVLGLCSLAAPLLAEERWVVAVAELPMLAERDGKGLLLAQLRALDRQLEGVSLELRVLPFARTLLLVRQGQADIQIPYVGLPQAPAGLRYGAEALGQVSFALYSRREQPLTREMLLAPRWRLSEQGLAASGLSVQQQASLAPLLGRSWRLEQLQVVVGKHAELEALAYPYRVETDRAHAEVLGFPALPSNTVRSSLERLMRGRIQGYVLAPINVEPEIDRLGLRDQLQAVAFADYQARWLVADSERGTAVAQRFSEALRTLKESGELDRVGEVLHQQMDWQPWP